MSYTQQQSVRMLSTHWDPSRFDTLHHGMLKTLMAPLHSQGHGTKEIAVERTALIRYVGQSTAVEVPFAEPLDLQVLGLDFRKRHNEIYGYATDEHWEMQSLRIRALVPRQTTFGPLPASDGAPEPTSVGPCWFEPAAPHQTPRFDRDRLPPDVQIAGPAVVEDAWSTIIVPPGYVLRADAMGHLWINEVVA
jgi:N-methylhydantoinase A